MAVSIRGAKHRLEEIEAGWIRDAIKLAKGVKASAARTLGMNRTTLVMKMKKYKIK